MTTSTLNFGWDFQNEPEVHHRQCFHPPPPGRNGSESGRRLRLPLARLVHIDARAMCAILRLREYEGGSKVSVIEVGRILTMVNHAS